ncbi:MAG: phosphoribosylanthranilate isomerase [Thermoproteus sp.]
MTLLKICGLTRLEDVELVDKLADYAGFIVDPSTGSPRRISAEAARELASTLSRAKAVAVFDAYSPADAVGLAARYDFPVAQIPEKFGEDIKELAKSFGISLAPVVLFGRDDVAAEARRLAQGSYEYVLIDAVKGSGVKYDFGLRLPLSLIEQVAKLERTAVAGGITPDNVDHVLKYRPYMVDVASGVESAPGVKDPAKVVALARKVKG